MNKILIVEDEFVVQDILRRLLEKQGYELHICKRGDEGLAELQRNPHYDLIISDLMLPGLSGMEILERAKAIAPDIPVIIITAYASVDSAVEAMRLGAFDYITKPFNNEETLMVIRKALERHELVEENRNLKVALNEKYGFENIIGHSRAMQEVFDLVRQAAPSSATILIRGESGTGKELMARAIHHNSPRKAKPFVALNAGSIPTDLLESQLFGHVKGAFTGATSDKQGLFEAADTGSFFLDEIGNIGMDLQAKLLRVLQEREFMPVGSTRVRKVDVRLVVATNADLEQMIKDGSFRDDLYYRMNVIELRLPPLRERAGDIPILVDHFIRKYETENDKKIQEVENSFLEKLESYGWPGNIRELENVIERAVILCRDGVITPALLPAHLSKSSAAQAEDFPGFDDNLTFQEQMALLEKTLIQRALQKSGGVQKAAAEMLGLKASTLSEMLKRHKLR